MATTTDTLKNWLLEHLRSGAFLPLDYAMILEGAEYPNETLASVNVEIREPLVSVGTLSGIFGGRSCTKLLPSGILPTENATLTVQNIGFILAPKLKEVIQVNVTIGFDHVSIPLTVPGTKKLFLDLKSLDFVLSSPGSTTELFMARADGEVDIESTAGNKDLTFYANMSLPGGMITLFQDRGSALHLGSFFSGLGLPDNGIVDDLSLFELDLAINPVSESFEMTGVLKSDSGEPVVLLQNVLSLEDMCFGLSYFRNSNLNGYVQGTLSFRQGLSLDVKAQMTSSSWQLFGNINIPTTAQNLGIQPVKGKYSISLLQLVEKCFGFSAQHLPPTVANLSINYLLIDYTYSKNGGAANKSYQFQGGLEDSWTLAGTDMEAEVSLSIIKDQEEPGNDEQQISASFQMDGFDFELSCDLTSATKEIEASITAEIQAPEKLFF